MLLLLSRNLLLLGHHDLLVVVSLPPRLLPDKANASTRDFSLRPQVINQRPRLQLVCLHHRDCFHASVKLSITLSVPCCPRVRKAVANKINIYVSPIIWSPFSASTSGADSLTIILGDPITVVETTITWDIRSKSFNVQINVSPSVVLHFENSRTSSTVHPLNCATLWHPDLISVGWRSNYICGNNRAAK